MGFYGDEVLPRIVNAVGGMKTTYPLRERVCDGLEGEVVEIGFGSGLNVPFYPASVRRVAAVEPADVGWKLAAKRLRASSVPVERSGLDGQSLPFEDASFDAGLSTWTMCTIPEIEQALAEPRRVTKPRGPTRPSAPGRTRGPPCASSGRASPPTRGGPGGSPPSSRCRSGSSEAVT